MAFVKRRSADHLLVGYRPVPGGNEMWWRCPSETAFVRFDAFEADHKASRPGVPVPPPGPMFGEVEPGRGRKDQSGGRDGRGARAESRRPTRAYTLGEWIGTPDAPGPYFTHASQMGSTQRDYYFTMVRLHAASIAGLPMDEVGSHEVGRVRDEMLVCKACLRRAQAAGRKDLVARPWEHLLGTKVPWDGRNACTDDDGGSAHYPRLQTATVVNYRAVMRAAWNVAIRVGMGKHPAEARCSAISENPFAHCPIPRYADRPDNNDLTQALTHTQVARLEAAMPPELACSIIVSVHGMLRREEVLGLDRGSIDWTSAASDGQAVLRITKVLRPGAGLQGFGKTAQSTREPIYLSPFATSSLRDHLDRRRSEASPETCPACAAGASGHYEASPNPHRRCPMADGAPLFVMPSTGDRPHPDTYSGICVEAAERAGLTEEAIGFRPTHKVLRATGATMLLEAGTPPETVKRMGRWTNIETLRRHYFRLRDAAKTDAASALDIQARGELGLSMTADLPPEGQVRYLTARVKGLETTIERYRAALTEHGVDVSSLDEPTLDRVHLREPPGTRPNPRRKKGPSPLEDGERIRRLIDAGMSRRAVLMELGMVPATPTYRRLEARAVELGIDMPAKWSRKAS